QKLSTNILVLADAHPTLLLQKLIMFGLDSDNALLFLHTEKSFSYRLSAISTSNSTILDTPMDKIKGYTSLSLLYSKISPGWQSNALQIASKVEKRIAFALPFFNIEIFAIVLPTFSESSVTLIFRFANITSRFTIMAIISPQTVKSFSVFISTASCNSLCKRAAKTAIRNDAKTTTIPITMIPGASSNLATKYKKGKITI